jgi:hypothetical protein
MFHISLILEMSLSAMGSAMFGWVPTPTDVQVWADNTRHYHQEAVALVDSEYNTSTSDFNARTRIFASSDGFKSICTKEFAKRANAVPRMEKNGLRELKFNLPGMYVHGYLQTLGRFMVCMHT